MKRCLVLLLVFVLLCACSAQMALPEAPLAEGAFRLRLSNRTDSQIHGFGYELYDGATLLCSGQRSVLDNGWLEPGQALSEDLSLDVFGGAKRCELKIYIIGSDSAKYCRNTTTLYSDAVKTVQLNLYADGEQYRIEQTTRQ